jgi:RNA polymerase sigma-70 factor (ECF subfamily)
MLVQSRTAMARNVNQTIDSDLPHPQIHGLRLAAGQWTSDYALARAAAHGAMPAMGDLYERHNRRVYAVCLGMTHDSAEAEDLTQEVFVHLLRKIGSFRAESRFTTWLHRLTVNLVLMHFRRRGRHSRQVVDDLEGSLSSSQLNRQPVGAQLADRMALDSALALLPSGCRSVFVLFDIEGYKHDEIANLLGCSVGTSKSQLHRARKKLRRLLKAGDESNHQQALAGCPPEAGCAVFL